VGERIKYRYRVILKVSMLACVYALHLIFFQAAMAASDHGPSKYLKTFLSRKADPKKNKPSPAGFYLQLIKLTNHGERPTVAFPPDVLQALSSHAPVVLKELPPVSKWFVYAHLPDDAFKLYQRIRVFLI